MRRNREALKRLVVTIIAVILIAIMVMGAALPFFASAEELQKPISSEQSSELGGTDFNIEAKIGNENSYKIKTETPVNIVVSNNSKDFVGSVEVKINMWGTLKQKENVVYEFPIEIAEGGNQKIDFNVSIETITRDFSVNILDKNKKVVAKKFVKIKAISDNDVYIGVLSDNMGDLDYLKELSFYNRQIEKDVVVGDNLSYIDYSESEFNKTSMSKFNIIIVNNFSSDLLTEEKIAALDDWVRKGGLLLIGTGVHHEKVLSTLGVTFFTSEVMEVNTINEISPFKKTETQEEISGENDVILNDISAISEEYKYDEYQDGLYRNLIDGETVVATFDLGDLESEEIFSDGASFYSEEEPLTFMLPKGTGYVITYTFDLADKVFVGNSEFLAIFQQEVSNYVQMQGSTNNNYRYGGMHYTNLNPVISNDSRIYLNLMYGLVLVYIAVVPIIYFVLKIKDKREKGWIVLPVSVTFVILILFILSKNSIYSKPISTSISVVNTTTGNVEAFGSVLTADKNYARLEFNDNYDLKYKKVQEYDYRNNYGANQNTSSKVPETEKDIIRVIEDDKNSIIYYGKEVWAGNYFGGNFKSDIQAGLRSDIKIEKDKIVGTITNDTQYTFSEVIVEYISFYEIYQNVKPGDVIEVDEPLNIKEAGSFDFDRRTVIRQLLDSSSGNYSGGYGSNYNYQLESIKTELLYSAMESLQLGEEQSYSYSYSAVAESRKERKPMDFEKISVYGISDENIIDYGIKINNKKTNDFSLNVLVSESNVNFIEKTSVINLPSGFITPNVEKSSKEYYLEDDRTINLSVIPADLDISYSVPKNATLIEFGIKNLIDMSGSVKPSAIANGGTTSEAIVELESDNQIQENLFQIYNVLTGEYETIETQEFRNTAENYVENGKIKVRYKNLVQNYVQLPPVEMKIERGAN